MRASRTFSVASFSVEDPGSNVGRRPIVAANFSLVAETDPGLIEDIVDESLLV